MPLSIVAVSYSQEKTSGAHESGAALNARYKLTELRAFEITGDNLHGGSHVAKAIARCADCACAF